MIEKSMDELQVRKSVLNNNCNHMNQERYRIGNIHISATNPKDAEEQITQEALKAEGGYICVSNVRMIRHAGKNSGYADLMEHSFMNIPDGKPLEWCAKLWGLKGVKCANGPALFKQMLKNGNKELKHYLLGDTQDVLDKIVETATNAHIVGAEALPFVKVEDFDYEGIAKRVASSGAQVVWTAMRAPKQDEFDQKLSKLIPNVVCVGVGRAFRLFTGEVQQAPQWAQKAGVAGIFTRKVSLWKAIQWYIESTFYLIGYFAQICWLRLKGRKAYE